MCQKDSIRFAGSESVLVFFSWDFLLRERLRMQAAGSSVVGLG